MRIIKFFFLGLFLFFFIGCTLNILEKEEIETAELFLDRAREYYLDSEYKKAIEFYKVILDKFPNDYYESAWATYETGICYYLLKEYQIAREYFVTVIQKYTAPKAVRVLALNLIRKIDYGNPKKRSFY